jgi:hypothetical protein
MYKYKTNDSIYKISENTIKGQDFDLLLGNFLDDFYYSDSETKNLMIKIAPLDMPLQIQVPYLAAIAHKLANDFELDVPSWVFEKRCYLPGDKPYFGCFLKGKLPLLFMYISPAEFIHRNIFICNNALTRV